MVHVAPPPAAFFCSYANKIFNNLKHNITYIDFCIIDSDSSRANMIATSKINSVI
jgi:hypothetical protein